MITPLSVQISSVRSYLTGALDWLRPYLTRQITHLDFLKLLLVSSFVVYGFEVFNFNLSIDEEVSAVLYTTEDEKLHWIKIGRWGMYFIGKCLFPFSIIPVLPLVVAIICYIFGIALIFYSWQHDFRIHHVFSGLLAITFPSLIFILTFSMLSFGIGLGYLILSVGFVFWSTRKTKLDMVVSSLFFGFAISIYQSFLLVIICILFLYLINQIINQPIKPMSRLFQEYVSFIFTVFLAGVFYLAMQHLMLFVFDIQYEYIDTYWHPEYLLKNTRDVVSKTAEYLVAVLFTGSADLYIDRILSLPIVIVGCLVSIMLMGRLHRNLWVQFYIVALIILTIVSPFALHLLNNGQMPVRSLLALPIAISGIVFIGLGCAKGILRYFLIVMASVAVLQCAVITIRLENSGHIALEADRLLGGNLIERIGRVSVARAQPEPRYLEVAGYHSWPESPLLVRREHIGASFFEWDGGNPWRILAFLKTLGFNQLRPIPVNKRCSLVSQVKQMALWPADGSIQVIDDTVVIKFGDYSASQRDQTCKSLYQN